MRKNNQKKNSVIIFIVFIVSTVLFTASVIGSDTRIIQSPVNDTNSIADKVINTPIRWIRDRSRSFTNLINTYEENRELRKEIKQYDELKLKAKNQSQEIERLKMEAELNQSLTSYEKITASVIARSPDTWQDKLIVDKGSSDGIEENMVVMSQKGLIGRVSDVSTHSSKIQLVTSSNKNSNHFPVKISSDNEESFGILDKYNNRTQQLIVSQTTKEKVIKEGATVLTSDLGGKSPANLAIGTVVKVKPANNGLDQEIYIKPYAQMHDISFVTIIL